MADVVLASLLLDLKKVNLESSIFIIELENITVTFGIFLFSSA